MRCPNCHRVSPCRVEQSTATARGSAESSSSGRRRGWHDRTRLCSSCARSFETREVCRSFVDEHSALERAWLVSMRENAAAAAAAERCEAIAKSGSIALDSARALVRRTAYWDHPQAYRLVAAPNHSWRLYEHRLGWGIDYGIFTFLPGLAIKRCHHEMAKLFRDIENGEIRYQEDALPRFRQSISGCVAGRSGREIQTYWSVHNGYMEFGVNRVCVGQGARFMLKMADPDSILLSRSSGR